MEFLLGPISYDRLSQQALAAMLPVMPLLELAIDVYDQLTIGLHAVPINLQIPQYPLWQQPQQLMQHQSLLPVILPFLYLIPIQPPTRLREPVCLAFEQ